MATESSDKLSLKYIPLSQLNRWNRNRKRHDIGGLVQSFRLHGFKDPLKFEPKLNGGAGGIVEGNGRDEALAFLYKEDAKHPPRGVLLVKGEWLVPVLFGVDAGSQAAAEAYGFDHNNLTLTGADVGLADLMRLYDPGTDRLLAEMAAESPEFHMVAIDRDTIDTLSGGKTNFLDPLITGQRDENSGEQSSGREFEPYINAVFPCTSAELMFIRDRLAKVREDEDLPTATGALLHILGWEDPKNAKSSPKKAAH